MSNPYFLGLWDNSIVVVYKTLQKIDLLENALVVVHLQVYESPHYLHDLTVTAGGTLDVCFDP